MVPKGRRKPVRTAEARPSVELSRQGGTATTASERAGQLALFRAAADSPQGAVAGADADPSALAPRAVPKPRTTKSRSLPATTPTMDEIANESNLRIAFQKVASNDGAPGPDAQSIDEVGEHLDAVLPALARELVAGSYRPGAIRRVWIAKAGGGERPRHPERGQPDRAAGSAPGARPAVSVPPHEAPPWRRRERRARLARDTARHPRLPRRGLPQGTQPVSSSTPAAARIRRRASALPAEVVAPRREDPSRLPP
jgi:hypothetical protein